MPGQALRIPGG